MPSDQVDVPVEVEDGAISFGGNKRSSVASLGLGDFVEVGVYLLFSGPAVYGIDLALRGDHTASALRKGPFVVELPFLIELFAEGVNLADISQ